MKVTETVNRGAGQFVGIDAAVQPPQQEVGVELLRAGSPNVQRAPQVARPNTTGSRSRPDGGELVACRRRPGR